MSICGKRFSFGTLKRGDGFVNAHSFLRLQRIAHIVGFFHKLQLDGIGCFEQDGTVAEGVSRRQNLEPYGISH